MKEREQSGLSIKAYCEHIGICGNTYFYWQRRVRAAAFEQICNSGKEVGLIAKSFTEVKLTEPSSKMNYEDSLGNGSIQIELGQVRITADGAYPPIQLAELLNGIIPLC
jgi:hypothetical protein